MNRKPTRDSIASRFALVGGVSTVIDFGILFLLRSIGVNVITANIASTAIAFAFSFTANKKFTFQTTNTNVRREIILFVIVTLFGLWVLQSLVIMAVSGLIQPHLANETMRTLVAKLLATVVSMTWNFILYKRVVFTTQPTQLIDAPRHIVLDTRIIETSTGRYMQRLLENLNDHHQSKAVRYTALVPSKHVKKWQTRLPHIAIVAADQKWYSFAEQWSLLWQLRRLKPDLVHFTMPQQPLFYTGKAITTVHDMTLIRYNTNDGGNELAYRLKKLVFLGLLHVVMRRAVSILVPTNFVKDDLGAFFGKKFLPKITVTPEAGEIPSVQPVALSQFADMRYFCFVGNAFPYKNIRQLVLAHEHVLKSHPDVHLLLAGKKDSFYEELEAFAKSRGITNVHFLGFISDGEKRWMLQHAVAFMTASLSEGFCIPLLEAMHEDCPVIASNASCLPEVAGDAALYFDPHSETQLADRMIELLTHQTLRTTLIEKGSSRAGSFSWQRMTEQTYNVYRSATDAIL